MRYPARRGRDSVPFGLFLTRISVFDEKVDICSEMIDAEVKG